MDVTLFFFIVWLCCIRGVTTGDMCNGTFLRVEPAILHKTVTLKFAPYVLPGKHDSIKWYKSFQNLTSKVTEDSNHHIYRNKTTFYMQIINATTADEQAGYYINYHECSSPIIRLNLTVMGDCGFLYLHTKTYREGEEVRIGYFSAQSVHKNLTSYVRKWIHQSPSCTGNDGASCARVLVLDSDMYLEKEIPFNNEYVLVLRNVSTAMNGMYTVQCTENQYNISNAVNISVPAKPNQPKLGSVRDIEDCPGCIVIFMRGAQQIRCSVTGGTPPVTISLYIDGIQQCTRTNGHCAIQLTNQTSHHMNEVRCEVNNSALVAPLTAVSKLYVLVNPTSPELHLQEPEEGKPLNISCTCLNGRPAAGVYFIISGKAVIHSKTVTHDNQTETFNSLAKLDYMKREWSGRNISCCRTYLGVQDECTDEQIITYSYAPKVKFNVSSEVTVSKGESIVLKCTAESEPPSNITWFHKDNETVPAYPMSKCDSNSICLWLEKPDVDDGGLFICAAFSPTFGLRDGAVTVVVAVPESESPLASYRNVIIGTSFATLAVLCILTIVVFVVIKKRRQTTKSQSDAPGNKENADDGTGILDESGAEMYAKVIPKSQRQDTEMINIQEPQDTSKHDLVYVELDLQPVTTNKAARSDSPTEYMAIDFTKKAEPIHIEEDISVNVYMNK